MDNYYNPIVDIVFCFNVINFMRDCIEDVKKNALNFKNDFLEALKEAGKGCSGDIRTKVIAFGDERIGKKLLVSPFFTLPEQEKEFQTFINGLTAEEGCDKPQSAYEALIEAFKSDWVKEGPKRRWITVMLTDSSAHTERFTDLVDAWNALNHNFKRLLLFAPYHSSWDVFVSQGYNILWLESSRIKLGFNVIIENIVTMV